jgi:hypothetical protein
MMTKEEALRAVNDAALYVATRAQRGLDRAVTGELSAKTLLEMLIAMRLLGQADIVRVIVTQSPTKVREAACEWLEASQEALNFLRQADRAD